MQTRFPMARLAVAQISENFNPKKKIVRRLGNRTFKYAMGVHEIVYSKHRRRITPRGVELL
jgi:hypothetical protein